MKQTHRPPRSIYPAQNRHMRRRTRVLAGLVAVLCFGGLLVRLFTLQILDPSGYANRAAAQQLRDTTLPAARGEIYSADGVTLAASRIPSAFTRRATLWAACWALPMWIIRAFGGWNCNMTPS